MGLIGVIASLLLLMYLAYRGINVLILAPILATMAALFAGAPVLGTYTQVFMPALGKYVVTYFPLFLLGAIFGKLMDDSGSARAIAQSVVGKLGGSRAILAVVLSCGILTYGGVSLFVVAFAVFPIAAALFRSAAVPKRLIPAAIALGSFTFTMTALPGTPAIQNAIPAPFFSTNAFAAPGLGIIGGLIMFLGGMAWLSRQAKRARLAGEGYHANSLAPDDDSSDGILGGEDTARPSGGDAGPTPDGGEPAKAPAGATAMVEVEEPAVDSRSTPPVMIALLPIFTVILANLALVKLIFPRMNFDYLAEKAYGGTKIDAVAGIWAIIVALILAIVMVLGFNWRRIGDAKKSVNEGTMGSLLPIFNTASEVGYGAVIASLPAFTLIKNAVLGISDNPVVSLAVSVNVLAGITGSASGGMSIALEALGEQFRQMADQQGISLELMHRVTAMASGGFDSLPHNGAVITLLTICGLTHRESYKDIGVVSVLIPLVALVVVVLLGSAFGGF